MKAELFVLTGARFTIQTKMIARRPAKKFGPFLDLCVSSLRRGHANLLCIVPILSDVPEGTDFIASLWFLFCCKLLTELDVGET
ncbi:hypothetical protein H5410_062913 [Solanum commersonii]|uniref:Uncharacterized protein n=1 Tax=Solanum commersonii TaxID=4109 RepID=A0A9J5WBQ5_SOLCO|nr:hypothetical protein H5410_062913 [Solanum commersonii]